MPLPSSSPVVDLYSVARYSDGRKALLLLYVEGSEPDLEVYEVLRSIDRDHVPEIIETGRWQDRAYEIVEDLRCGTLADLGLLPDDSQTLSRILSEVGGALSAFAECGLRHRDLSPGAILVRSRDPLDLVITNFGSARLSEFDLEIVAPLEMTRYTAPEAVAGGVAAASDWWSLGMVILEQVTRGACFAGVDDQTFLIHVLASGAPIPDGLPDDVDLLLRGLLARNRHERWGWDETRLWLNGDPPSAPERGPASEGRTALRTIALSGQRFDTPASFALEAARAGNWQEACELLLRGEVSTWLEESGYAETASEIRRLCTMYEVSDDMRLALALKVLNPAMPLVCRGSIVTPNWLLDHPEEGYELISGPIPDLLERKDAETWLSRLKAREARVRDRARRLSIELNEVELRVNLLSTSGSRLAALWNERRRVLPDTDHSGLLAIVERKVTAEEDLILLLSADIGQFRAVDAILHEAAAAARSAGLERFDRLAAAAWLERPRRELYAEIERRIERFSRCGRDRIDGWADQFRLEHRLSADRALAILAVPEGEWRQPENQSYVANLLDFYEKRITVIATRGPLSRMVIGKTTARIDLTELSTERRPATEILDHLLLRSEQPIDVDPAVFARDLQVENRIRRLHNHATLYRRDTGIDGLYLGFPFLAMREPGATRQPRIAPILLWPVRLSVEVGARGRIHLSFDRGREEVRLNPIFATLLGINAAARWEAAARELLGRSSVTANEVMDVFADLAATQSNSLTQLPDKDLKVVAGEDRLYYSAVLFHLAFIGQAVNEDLRNLKSIPPIGSALERVLRIGNDPVEDETLPPVPPADRYFTAPTDPSQEKAVLRARGERGLLIEGPPGTGKSQTIVNMVSDAIGRNRSLLIVCQKQAALEVVHRRLEAEGLGNRVVMVTDVNRDRRPIINAIRDQLTSVRSTKPSSFLEQREQVASRLHALESDLDAHHQALHAEDQATGLTYRRILAELVGVAEESADSLIPESPSLRQILGPLNPSAVAMLQESCAPLARLWLPAKFEDSVLAILRPFSHEAHTIQSFTDSLVRFQSAETERAQVNERTPKAISIEDPAPYQRWSDRHASRLINLTPEDRIRLARYFPHFECPGGEQKTLEELRTAVESLTRLPADIAGDAEVLVASSMPAAELAGCIADADRVLGNSSLLQRLSISHWRAKSRTKRLLREKKLDDLGRWRQAAAREQVVGPLRQVVSARCAALGEPPLHPASRVQDIIRAAEDLIASIQYVTSHLDTIREYPDVGVALAAARAGTQAAIQDLVTSFEEGFARLRARQASLKALSALDLWIEEPWVLNCRQSIALDGSTSMSLSPVLEALPSAGAYQRFRARATGLSADALRVFAALRPLERSFLEIPERELDSCVRRVLFRESRLAWKTRIENENPSLLFEADELESKVRSLEEADGEMRSLNRRLLVEGIDTSGFGLMRDWEDITRLQGPRARRLREFLDRGADIGLMSLRPVWLMNPDVASRLLPLRKTIFDTVIYDEASQMPIEYALPTLFRARRVVVSGDEKQMPPTSFFSSKIESDEAELYEGEFDEDVEEEERQEAEQTWNRREIKDCPDLLKLAQTVLPTTTLQIHYRSVFRELIQFSNASFYANTLSVPIRLPDEVVRQARPIEVMRVDGVYDQQTNRAEAERVAEVLADLWSGQKADRPTIGVVTFNRKQADLIEDVLEERATVDASFARAFSEERERIEEGEDVSFFVKNVENVQGDERDVIVFSSTFGRNAQNMFKRSFGVLGQEGGQRRLNVAVTRAKKKVVLVTSMPTALVSDFLSTRRVASSPRDFLQAYLEYAKLISDGEMAPARLLLRRLSADQRTGRAFFDDIPDAFQLSVRDEIRRLGWDPVEVSDDGAFGLDFAIEDPATGTYGIGIECDAPVHELLADARAREMWRPKVLRRSIPTIHRVSSHRWLHEPEIERARLREAIKHSLGRTA